MPRSMKQFDVVISAPNNLINDAKIIEDFLKNLNNTFDPRGIVIRSRHWSHAAVPGLGTEGQEVVRKQLLENCDILVALIGRRLGTPTSEHESGTADEIAYMSQRDGSLFNNKHVQIYFKNEQVNMDDIDIDEIQRVK